MYRVIMVDDDYPVLELLSEAIDWTELGYELQGMYENGAVAYQAVSSTPPDVVITDIGMPRMNGIELLRELKAVKDDLKAIILTCHDDFEFAKQALQLGVHEYMLKETFVPEDLRALLTEMKRRLDVERQALREMDRLQRLAHTSSMLVKQRFIRQLLQQPLLHVGSWQEEARPYGIAFDAGLSCLPVLAYVDDYLSVKSRFIQEDTLLFAVSNVFDEALSDIDSRAVHFVYDAKRSFVLINYRPTIASSIYTEATAMLSRMQAVLKRTLKLSMSFIIGETSRSPQELQASLLKLSSAVCQRFYMNAGDITVLGAETEGQDDLFSWYDAAMNEFRELLVQGDTARIHEAMKGWMERIRRSRCRPEQVKDWALKLLLDMKLKLHALGSFRAANSADVLHKEADGLDTLAELEAWLLRHFCALADRMVELVGRSGRIEIQQACQYVERHMDKRITLDEVAAHLHLNASYFSRLFHKENGMTFIEYVTHVKINRAKELLDQTTHSIGKICEMLGYDNQSYFIKTFKNYVGLTPSEYRGVAKDKDCAASARGLKH